MSHLVETFSLLLAQVPLELVIYQVESIYAFDSKVTLRLAKCVNFQNQAIFTEKAIFTESYLLQCGATL